MTSSAKTPDTIRLAETGRQVSDATILMHEAIARKVGLSGADHKYLSILLQHGTMTAGQLSDFTGLTTGAVTGVIDRLEKKTLVRRVADKTDRRKILIEPDQQKADALFGNVHLDLKEKIGQLLSKYSPEEQTLIEGYLLASINIMKEVTTKLNA